MIIVNIDNDISFDKCRLCMDYISMQRREKINRFYFEKDKLLSLFGALVVRLCIIRKYNIPNKEIVFNTGTYGKPFLSNRKEYNFSLSHSGRCIAFVESNFPVGIDIEQIRESGLDIAKRYFSEKERKYTENSPDFNKSFTEIWTTKEAYIKMTGNGLSEPLDSFWTISGVQDYYFTHEHFLDYIVSLCLHKSQKKEETEFLDCYEIMDFFCSRKEFIL